LARQQHRLLISAVVAQPQPEAAAGALADQQRQLALLQAVTHVAEQPGGVEPLDTRAQIAQRNPRGRLEPERARQKRGRHGRSPDTANRTLVTRTESGAAGAGGRGATRRRPTLASISGSAARAAASPRAISSPARPKPKLVNARTSGTMSTSHAPRSARSESHTRNDTDCASTSTSDTIESRGSSGSVTSLQISTSAPRARASRAGRLRTTPPSIRTFGPSSTGANTLGSAMLARIASGRNPRSGTTAWPVSRSVATAANGMGSRRKSWM